MAPQLFVRETASWLRSEERVDDDAGVLDPGFYRRKNAGALTRVQAVDNLHLRTSFLSYMSRSSTRSALGQSKSAPLRQSSTRRPLGGSRILGRRAISWPDLTCAAWLSSFAATMSQGFSLISQYVRRIIHPIVLFVKSRGSRKIFS